MGHRARWQRARCPEDFHSNAWRILMNQLELSKVHPSEDYTFGDLLSEAKENLMRVESLGECRMGEGECHHLSGFGPKWEQSVWKLTNAICDMWEYDPTLSCDSKAVTLA